MTQAKDYLAEANAAVPRISAEDGIRIHDGGGAVFIDVRDSAASPRPAPSPAPCGSARLHRIRRRQSTSFHNPALQKDSEIVIVCAAAAWRR